MARQTTTAVDRMFLDRWSPRSFDSSPMPHADMETILDAARWAPSAFNYQPWRFIYAHRSDPSWLSFVDALLPFNQCWACNGSVLVFAVSHKTMGDAPSYTHSFDTGIACGMLSLQATALGYNTHCMSGLDFERCIDALGVPDDFRIEAAIVVGRRSDAAALPAELRERESPSDRKSLGEIAFSGRFPDSP